MQTAHLKKLQQKHRDLEQRIHEELKHPSGDDLLIRRLKEEKLHLREEIERFSHAAVG